MSEATAVAYEKEKLRKGRDELELRDMMNGGKAVAAGADRMLKLMKEE
jgi:hypothetical protein